MDLAAMRQACRNALGVPSTDPLVSTSKLDGWLNDALQELSVERDWPWLFHTDATNTATVADQAAYTLPSDWRDTVTVTINERPLRRITVGTHQAFDTYGDWHTDYHYSVMSGSLTIDPAPAAVLDLVHVYIRDEAVLAGDSDEPYLPSRWRHALVRRACASCCLANDDAGGHDRFRGEYDAWVRKMLRHTQPKPRVYVRPGSML